jgi:hypothetical protein
LGGWTTHQRSRACALGLVVASVAVAGCGGSSNKPQDENEPSGNFPVEVTSATFPAKQKLAKESTLEIVVRNASTKRVPNVNVTLKCKAGNGGSFNVNSQDADVADSERPQFVVNQIPTRTKRKTGSLELDPLERSSAFVDTYPLGPLAANRTARFEWKVTAVKAGPYKVCYKVNAGLYGKAKAISGNTGLPLAGTFSGEVSNKAPKTRVAEDGTTVVKTEDGKTVVVKNGKVIVVK